MNIDETLLQIRDSSMTSPGLYQISALQLTQSMSTPILVPLLQLRLRTLLLIL